MGVDGGLDVVAVCRGVRDGSRELIYLRVKEYMAVDRTFWLPTINR